MCWFCFNRAISIILRFSGRVDAFTWTNLNLRLNWPLINIFYLSLESGKDQAWFEHTFDRIFDQNY